MIAVDTSALMAIVLDEPDADACIAALTAEDDVIMSAGTLAEAMIVAHRRNVAAAMARLIDGAGLRVIDVTPASARRVAQAHAQWGRGIHRAGLNFGDCFSYEVAREHECRLLFIGDDFSRTDLTGVL